MLRQDALEAAPIVDDTLAALLVWAPISGRPGSDLRTAVSSVRVNAMSLLRSDKIGPPLLDCFEKAVATGATLANIEAVRRVAAASSPTLVGAVVVRDALIQFCLAAQGQILVETEFVSRTDVDQVRTMINASCAEIEEDLADRMDAMTYRAVVELHAAISFYLTETARPLPQMLSYSFNTPLSTLVIAQKLYADALRADELRKENKVIHPAFCRLQGRALSN